MPTIQEIFEFDVKALLKQNKKSVDVAFNDEYAISIEYYGAYRGEDGLKCAIGHLIDDKDYGIEMEENGILSLLEWCKFNHSPYLQIDNDTEEEKQKKLVLFEKLQIIHDNEEVKNWRTCFIDLGKKLGLKTDFIEEIN